MITELRQIQVPPGEKPQLQDRNNVREMEVALLVNLAKRLQSLDVEDRQWVANAVPQISIKGTRLQIKLQRKGKVMYLHHEYVNGNKAMVS